MTTESRTAATTVGRSGAGARRGVAPLAAVTPAGVPGSAVGVVAAVPPSGPATRAAVPPAARTADRSAAPTMAAAPSRARPALPSRVAGVLGRAGAMTWRPTRRSWSERHRAPAGRSVAGSVSAARGWRRGHGRTSETPWSSRAFAASSSIKRPGPERRLRARSHVGHRTRAAAALARWSGLALRTGLRGRLPVMAAHARAAESTRDRGRVERAVGSLRALGDDERADLDVRQRSGVPSIR